MFSPLLGYILGFSAGAIASRGLPASQSRIPRGVYLAVAIVMSLLFFGYIFGTDLAKRDKSHATSFVLPSIAHSVLT